MSWAQSQGVGRGRPRLVWERRQDQQVETYTIEHTLPQKEARALCAVGTGSRHQGHLPHMAHSQPSLPPWLCSICHATATHTTLAEQIPMAC